MPIKGESHSITPAFIHFKIILNIKSRQTGNKTGAKELSIITIYYREHERKGVCVIKH